MSRPTPVPTVAIGHNVITDDESGRSMDTILIDVKVTDDISNGFIVLDDPGDLYILRNAIDDFITRNNIKNPFL